MPGLPPIMNMPVTLLSEASPQNGQRICVSECSGGIQFGCRLDFCVRGAYYQISNLTMGAIIMDLSDITLEIGADRDIPIVAEMSRDLIEYGLPWSWTSTRIMRCMQSRESIFLIATNKDLIAGFALMELRDEYAHLNLFAVAPGFRRIGLGARMLSWLEVSARTSGVFDIFLEVRADNSDARTFYRKMGYRTVAWLPSYYQKRFNGVRMVHNMAQPLPNDKARWDRAIHRILAGLSDKC